MVSELIEDWLIPLCFVAVMLVTLVVVLVVIGIICLLSFLGYAWVVLNFEAADNGKNPSYTPIEV